ncbi:unnamed protein product [Fraxinus pennsylvanica]|uniref:SHSP domain-containing protein n=1 Tax=Fraxinus pennsylvanica TaxID=56036 RepID=A0AAD1Z916_9LAMI|nr:unnamed protein product [Fraxinus pennsylvanica]
MATPRQRHGGAAAPNRPRMVGVQLVYEDNLFQNGYKMMILIFSLFKFLVSSLVSFFSSDIMPSVKVKIAGQHHKKMRSLTPGLVPSHEHLPRVRGERLVAGNKWSRFQEDFQVSDNSDLTSIRTKHGGGTLIVTVPRKNIAGRTLTNRKEENEASQATLIPRPKARDQFLPPKTTGMKSPREPEPDRQGQDKVTPTISSSKPITDDKSIEPAPRIQKTSGDNPITKIELQEDEQKSHIEETSPEMTEKPAAYENIADKAGKRTGALKLELKKQKKKAAKGLGELNEERQLLVNTGAALLINVGLGAYVSYSFASQNDKH